jgi:uncharacterized protein YndB with AHSA1/START domain
MNEPSRHISVHVARPAGEVYTFAADPRNLPRWAAGLAGATVEEVDGEWVTDSPMGRVTFTFAPTNDFGVLDHDVRLPDGETVHNPLRVLRDEDGSEVVFTLRHRPGMTEDDFERDAAAIARDLATLKGLVEGTIS